MKKQVLGWLLMILFQVMSTSALAASYEVRPGIEVSIATLPSSWQVSKTPPAFLVRERAAHLHEPQLAAARKAGFDTPEEAARQMLQVNELFIFNPQSGGHLEVDFSPLKAGEEAPTAGTLKASARYAAEGLETEEGIEAVRAKVGKTDITGADAAFRVDAEFRSHGEPTRFVGIITFASNHWIYLYYTGPQSAAEDLTAVNRIMESLSIRPVPK